LTDNRFGRMHALGGERPKIKIRRIGSDRLRRKPRRGGFSAIWAPLKPGGSPNALNDQV